MANNSLGLSYLGAWSAAEESFAAAYATAVASNSGTTVTVPILSESFSVTEGFVLTGGINSSAYRKVSQPGRRIVQGGIQLEPDGNSLGLLFKWANRNSHTPITSVFFPAATLTSATIASGGALPDFAYFYKVANVFTQTSSGKNFLGNMSAEQTATSASSNNKTNLVMAAATPPQGYTVAGTVIFRTVNNAAGDTGTEHAIDFLPAGTSTTAYSDLGTDPLATTLTGSSTLGAAITTTPAFPGTTALTVASSLGMVGSATAGTIITIATEQMRVSVVTDATHVTVIRGANGTTPATALINAALTWTNNLNCIPTNVLEEHDFDGGTGSGAATTLLKSFTTEVNVNAAMGPGFAGAGTQFPAFTATTGGTPTVISKQFKGCKVNTLSLTIPGNGPVTMSVEMHAQDQASIAATIPTFSLIRPFMGFDAYVLLQPKNSAVMVQNVTLEHFQVSLSNNLNPRYSLNGSRTCRRLSELRRKVSGSFSLSFESLDQYLNVVNDTDMSIRVICTGPSCDQLSNTPFSLTAALNTIVRAQPFMFQIDLPAISYTTAQANLNGENQIMQNVPFEAWLPDVTTNTAAAWDCQMSTWDLAASYPDVA